MSFYPFLLIGYLGTFMVKLKGSTVIEMAYLMPVVLLLLDGSHFRTFLLP